MDKENAEIKKETAMERLMKELDAGRNSGALMDEEAVYQQLGVDVL